MMNVYIQEYISSSFYLADTPYRGNTKYFREAL